jgi:phosphoribosylanthranilate isomerase
MIDGIRFKVCGLTTLVDAEFADQAGADYLGFILAPQSPRHLSLRTFAAMSTRLPAGRKRVAVVVEPTLDTLREAMEAGFDYFQVHFRHDLPVERVEEWSQTVGAGRLWLVPKRPPDVPFNPAWLPHAGTFMVDTFQASGFGGSGKTGDWSGFARLRDEFPKRTWILAGGLGPDNIADALNQSGARFIDVNSGVETAPGVKDHAKLRALVLAIHRAREEPPAGA